MPAGLILIGYDAKKVLPRTDWLAATPAEEVCSLSGCISPGLSDDAFDQWRHNALCLYDDETTVDELIAAEDAATGYQVFAYRLYPVAFHPSGETETTLDAIPELAGPRPAPFPLTGRFKSLGFDCVQTEWENKVAGFGCSPLSCNGLATRIIVNRHCLIDGLDRAIATARIFAKEQPEPGTYFVIEVLRRRSDRAGP